MLLGCFLGAGGWLSTTAFDKVRIVLFLRLNDNSCLGQSVRDGESMWLLTGKAMIIVKVDLPEATEIFLLQIF